MTAFPAAFLAASNIAFRRGVFQYNLSPSLVQVKVKSFAWSSPNQSPNDQPLVRSAREVKHNQACLRHSSGRWGSKGGCPERRFLGLRRELFPEPFNDSGVSRKGRTPEEFRFLSFLIVIIQGISKGFAQSPGCLAWHGYCNLHGCPRVRVGMRDFQMLGGPRR